MIPENALEEMTKNMDPNLVIVEVKDGVQMKSVSFAFGCCGFLNAVLISLSGQVAST